MKTCAQNIFIRERKNVFTQKTEENVLDFSPHGAVERHGHGGLVGAVSDGRHIFVFGPGGAGKTVDWLWLG